MTEESANDVTAETDDDESAHLDGITSGEGCAEIWETLSQQRRGDD